MNALRIGGALMSVPGRRWYLATLLALSTAGLLGACAGDDASTPPMTPIVTITDSTPGTPPNLSVLSGAEATERTSRTIKVGGASDLRNVITELQAEIDETCKTKITFVFGSSGQLSTQIQAGAEFGLFLSADSQYPADLKKAGIVVPNGIGAYGLGRIAIATRSGLEPVTDLDGLARSDVKRIAIANPAHAPYGRAAVQALQSAGVYDSLKGKLVLGENIRQTTDYVEKGDADAAIVAFSLVVQDSPAKYTLIDSEMHDPIEQTGAVIKGTGAELTGRCILQYILDPKGQEALKRYGFEPIQR